jgi:hypothetical protein
MSHETALKVLQGVLDCQIVRPETMGWVLNVKT